MKTVPFWLVLALLIPGCASELVLEKDGALAVIPREDRTSKHLVVDTMVSGEGPFRFAIDTAASMSVLVESTAEAAGANMNTGTRVLLRGMTGSGIFPTATAEQIAVGGLTWKPELLVLLPDESPVGQRMDGLLGTDFLSQYIVAYSADERALRFYPKEVVQGQGSRGWFSVPLFEIHIAKSDATVLVFNMVIGAERVPTILDIGADASMMNHRAARTLGVRTRKRTGGGVAGATGPTIYTTQLVFWEISLGGQRLHRRNFLVAEFPVFEALSLHNRPAAIAGIDLFDDHDFIIDFAGERLLIRRSR